MVLDISDLARRTDVAASALRFYEEKGLIRSVGRSGIRRVFEASTIERLALIALARGGLLPRRNWSLVRGGRAPAHR